MFAASTTPLDVAASVAQISSPTVATFLPYAYVTIGLVIGYWVIKKIIGLIPKHK